MPAIVPTGRSCRLMRVYLQVPTGMKRRPCRRIAGMARSYNGTSARLASSLPQLFFALRSQRVSRETSARSECPVQEAEWKRSFRG